jgi:hypothetical protein
MFKYDFGFQTKGSNPKASPDLLSITAQQPGAPYDKCDVAYTKNGEVSCPRRDRACHAETTLHPELNPTARRRSHGATSTTSSRTTRSGSSQRRPWTHSFSKRCCRPPSRASTRGTPRSRTRVPRTRRFPHAPKPRKERCYSGRRERFAPSIPTASY